MRFVALLSAEIDPFPLKEVNGDAEETDVLELDGGIAMEDLRGRVLLASDARPRCEDDSEDSSSNTTDGVRFKPPTSDDVTMTNVDKPKGMS